MIDGEIRMVPLSKLTLSKLNPRQDCTSAEVEALAMSLRTIGLLQNLAAYEEGPEAFGVVAGGRRLRALQLNAEIDGGNDPLVPVKVTSDMDEAMIWASAENAARVALNPADEVAAYAEMARSGATPDVIARAFAVTVREVRGRLKLAVLAPEILAALRSGDVSLDVAAAYTVADDHEAQMSVFRRLQGRRGGDEPATIKGALRSDASDANRLAQFVGREVYEAEGGGITENLFGDEIYFDDVALLNRLAEAKIAEIVAELKAAGWRWVEASLEGFNYDLAYSLLQIAPTARPLSEDEARRLEDLVELVNAGSATDRDEDEAAVLKAKSAPDWSEEQRAVSGVILGVTQGGEVKAQYGRVAAEDVDEAAAKGFCKPRAAPAAKPKGIYSAALEADLAAIRTAAVQTALLRKPDLALDLVTFALTHPTYTGAFPVSVRSESAKNLPEVGGETVKLPEALAPERKDYMSDTEAAAAFSAFREKSKKERGTMLTHAIARAFGAGLALDDANEIVEAVVTLSGASVREVWTPDGAFLARLSVAQLVEIERSVLGDEAVKDRPVKEPKRALVDRLAAIFAGGDGAPALSADQKARVAAWKPAGL